MLGFFLLSPHERKKTQVVFPTKKIDSLNNFIVEINTGRTRRTKEFSETYHFFNLAINENGIRCVRRAFGNGYISFPPSLNLRAFSPSCEDKDPFAWPERSFSKPQEPPQGPPFDDNSHVSGLSSLFPASCFFCRNWHMIF